MGSQLIRSVSSDFTTGVEDGMDSMLGALLTVYLVYMVVLLAICVVVLIANWKIFKKAGYPGWYTLIPVFSAWKLCEVAFGKGKGWICLLTLIPFVGAFVSCYMEYQLSKAFGKDVGFCVLAIFFSPITRCILGFGNSKYQLGTPTYY